MNTLDLQDKIISTIARSIKIKWDYLLVNFERAVIDGDAREDCLAVCFHRDPTGWKHTSIQPPFELYDLLLELAAAMDRDERGVWGSCTIEIDSRGKYRYTFSYEPPKRLNGGLDDETLFNHYVPQPL